MEQCIIVIIHVVQLHAENFIISPRRMHIATTDIIQVYVGNLPPNTDDADLVTMFSPFGRIIETKLYRKGGYGFVRFDDHESAVQAICDMHGRAFGEHTIKCSWGRFPNGQRMKHGIPPLALPDVQQPFYMPTPVAGTLPYLPTATLMPTATMMPSHVPSVLMSPAAAMLTGGGAGLSPATRMVQPNNPAAVQAVLDAQGMYFSAMYSPYQQQRQQ